MTFQSGSLTRRRALLVGATAVAGVAGCTEDTDTGQSNTDGPTNGDGPEQNSSETDDSGDSEETGEDDEQSGEDAEEDTGEDDAEDDSEKSNERAAVRVTETYVTPVNHDAIYPTYTPRTTVTTIDGFAVQLEIPSLDSEIGVDTDGVEFLLDGQPLRSRYRQIIQEGSSGPLTVAILMRQEISTGEHTFEIEIADSLVDLPEGQATASASVDFTVEEPDGTLRPENPPITENTEFVLETNIAPGQDVPLQMQAKPGEDPAFFLPFTIEVNSDGRGTFTQDFVALEEKYGGSLAGAKGKVTARPATDSVPLVDRTFTLREPSQ